MKVKKKTREEKNRNSSHLKRNSFPASNKVIVAIKSAKQTALKRFASDGHEMKRVQRYQVYASENIYVSQFY